MKNNMLVLALMGLFSLGLVGCETMEGAGEDMENAGEEIQEEANENE